MVRRSNNQAGSVYHLSSLRYAEGESSVHQGAGHHLPSGPVERKPVIAEEEDHEVGARAAATRRAKVDRFAEAEDTYRAGHSSSSSLLLRSSLISTLDSLQSQQHPSPSSPSVTNGVTVDRDAIEGFHRTKVRSLLAQSVPSSASAIDGRSIGSRDEAHLIDQLNTTDVVGGSSSNNSVYYLRNRRAKHPLSREKYERDRKVRRLIHDRARKRAKQEETGEKEAREGGRLAVGRDDDEIEEDDGGNTNFDDLTEREQEEVDRNIKEAIEQTHELMPSGTLLETIHYVASHYYDARGKLFLATNRSGEKGKKKAQKGNGETNVWRAFESNALVALGVYLEEMIKYEATGAAAGSNEGAEEETLDVAEKLAQVQDEIRKQRRRTRTTTPTPAEQPTKKKAKARKNARRNRVDVGWALPKSQSGPSRRQIESSPALDAAGDDDNDDDDNHDNDSDDNDDRSSQGNGSEASSEQSSTSRE